MGIRIRKVMGYGLVDVKTSGNSQTGFRIDDPRFKIEYTLDPNKPPGKTIEGFFEFSKKLTEKENVEGFKTLGFDIHLIKGITFRGYDDKPQLYQFTTWETEGGLPNVLVLTPITSHDWVRVDDSIDYYDERTRERSREDGGWIKGYWELEPHFSVLDTPLYPYDSYINNETGERTDDNVREWIYQFRNASLELMTNPKLTDKQVGQYYENIGYALEKLECDTHWTEKWNVTIPAQIIHYCKYVEMFVDESNIYKLQPMIYTYWS